MPPTAILFCSGWAPRYAERGNLPRLGVKFTGVIWERVCRSARRTRLFSGRVVAIVCVPATIGAQTGDAVGGALGSLEEVAALAIEEWLKFLLLIDHQTPADTQLHLVVDNYATHKHPAVHLKIFQVQA